MLPWWGWLLLWVVLLVGGAVLVGFRVRTTWHSVRALSAELSRSGRLLAELETVTTRSAQRHPPVTAVTQDPHRMWAQYRQGRRAARADRAERRARRRPPWARA